MRYVLLFIVVLKTSFALVIMPPILNMELDKPEAREIRIINDSSFPKRYMVEVIDDIRYKNHSLKDNIKVFPKIISLSPREERDIRIRVTPKEDIHDGEYKAYLLLKEMPLDIDKYENNNYSNNKIKTKINTLIHTKISVYGIYGDIDKRLDIKSNISENIITSNIKSIGNSGSPIWSKITIKSEDGSYRIVEKAIARIARSEEIEVLTKVELKSNEKISDIVYDF